VVVPSRLTAVHENRVPAVSAVRVTAPHPVDEDTGPLKDQFNVTLVTYQPFRPIVP
jgi:hypothetical protein